jgi:hypothetical protein
LGHFEENPRIMWSAGASFVAVQLILIWYIYTSIEESKDQDKVVDFYNLYPEKYPKKAMNGSKNKKTKKM